jgi:hypothetical protein
MCAGWMMTGLLTWHVLWPSTCLRPEQFAGLHMGVCAAQAAVPLCLQPCACSLVPAALCLQPEQLMDRHVAAVQQKQQCH